MNIIILLKRIILLYVKNEMEIDACFHYTVF
jgi:hypothetical protein